MSEQTIYRDLDHIKKLSVAERISIVEDIWESIVSSEENLPLSDEQKNELDLRLEKHYKRPKEGKNWKDVKSNIQSQL